jgi:hypothetical protein
MKFAGSAAVQVGASPGSSMISADPPQRRGRPHAKMTRNKACRQIGENGMHMSAVTVRHHAGLTYVSVAHRARHLWIGVASLGPSQK